MLYTKDLILDNIFYPSKIPSKKLMIVLHGRGDSSRGFSWLPEYFNIDNMNYLLLDAPYEYFEGYSWYDLPPNQLIGIAHSSAILAEIFDELFADEFDISQSFLFGFSQGALLTFEFGARYEYELAGYIAISGYIYDPELLLKEMSISTKNKNWICTHGKQDEILPYENTKSQIEILQNGGMSISFYTYEKEHTIVEHELRMIKTWIEYRL